ncbi:hypothetical protein Tco_1289358 [Tanacetum coccineum]
MRKVNTFVQIKSEVDKVVLELAAGSSKRVAEEELDQESSKRQKIGESSELVEEPRDKEADELSQEELQQMMIIVPKQGMNSLVKEKFNSTEPTDDKEREIWVELKRLFEQDLDDELWKLQKHIHDLTWKLYDSCEVHHVSTEKGIDIYMLVEMEYPLSRGTLTLMMVAKLLVDQDNEMSRELLRKIFMQGRIIRIKRLFSAVEVNAASYDYYRCWLCWSIRMSREGVWKEEDEHRREGSPLEREERRYIGDERLMKPENVREKERKCDRSSVNAELRKEELRYGEGVCKENFTRLIAMRRDEERGESRRSRMETRRRLETRVVKRRFYDEKGDLVDVMNALLATARLEHPDCQTTAFTSTQCECFGDEDEPVGEIRSGGKELVRIVLEQTTGCDFVGVTFECIMNVIEVCIPREPPECGYNEEVPGRGDRDRVVGK